MKRRGWLIAVALTAALVWDWTPMVPPFPVHTVAGQTVGPSGGVAMPSVPHPFSVFPASDVSTNGNGFDLGAPSFRWRNLYATTATLTSIQGGVSPLVLNATVNNVSFIALTRFTDTSPTGNFLTASSAAGTVLAKIDINGDALFGGLILGASTSNFVTSTAGYDLVIGQSGPTVLANGPGTSGITLRNRASSVPGQCKLTVAGGSQVGETTIIDNIPCQ